MERRNISLGMAGLAAMLATNHVVERHDEALAVSQALRVMKGLFASAPLIFEPAGMKRAVPVFEEDRARLEAARGERLRLLDLARRENRFFVSAAECDQIAAPFCPLGDQAEAVIAGLGRHVRPPRG